MTLAGRTALVTGAARGIGLATAAALARAGADVAGLDLRVADLAEAEAAVTDAGQRFLAVVADVSDPAACRRAVAEVTGAFGGLGLLVNNAGVAPSGAFGGGDFETWRRTVQINLVGTMAMTHAALPALRPDGHIVNVASVSGVLGTAGLAAYAASKHGVVGFSEALRHEVAGANVGVSCVCPAMVRTRMTVGVRRSRLVPLLEPEEVADAVVDAVRRDRAVVFVPRRMRALVHLLPTLLPGFARRLARRDATAQGWLDAAKPIPE